MTARLVRAEIEVPGTPEEVWEAIATGPGIACWFVPAEVDERVGGEIVTHHGPYGDSRGVVTGWEPPRRFAYEERDWAEGAPPWATEILVEARAGGTCLVRLVSGVFSGGEDWGDDIDATEAGWQFGLENLRLYLTHFAGRRCSHALAVGTAAEPFDARGPPSPRRSACTGRPRARASTGRWSPASSSARSTRWCCCATPTGSSRSTRTRGRARRISPARVPVRRRRGRVAAREEPALREWMDAHLRPLAG